MKAIKTEFDLGKTRFDQPVRLVHGKGSDGRYSWAIYRDAASQRDDTETVRGLTDEQLLAMADAVRAMRDLDG